ncbi:MAG: hypothetical protein WC608_02085 [Parcubacteria group bacterium]
MKTESIRKFPHLLLDRCRKFWNWCKAVGWKRFTKYGFFYALYVAIVVGFDWLYMPWLAIKFRYFAIVPLYFSLFIVSWLGLLLYRSFKEDMLFMEKINAWLNNEGDGDTLSSRIKAMVRGNPKKTFAAISTWWSPIHGYLYFKKDKQDKFWETSKKFAVGSFYCALFWGVVIDILIFLWDMFSVWDMGIFILAALAVLKMKNRNKQKILLQMEGLQ